MLGKVSYAGRPGRAGAAVESVGRLSILSVTLFEPEGLPRWRLRRRIRHVIKILREGNVRRVIFPAGFPYQKEFAEFGQIEPLPFYRGIADLLVLGCLDGKGLDPARETAALSAPRLCPELMAAAERLCPRLKGLTIDVPGEGERYAAWLHRRYGLPVGPPGRAAVTVAFGPGGGRWGTVLSLHEGALSLAGLEVTAPEWELPPDCADRLLAAMWERGYLEREQLRVDIRRNTP